MQINQVNLGKKLYLQVVRNNKILDYKDELISQLVDIINEDEIYISVPIFNGSTLNLYLGDRISMAFTHDGGVYAVDGQVNESVDENGMLFYKAKLLSNIKRIQRREHYRLPIQVPIIYHLDGSGKELYGQGITKDISGGGLRFVSGHKISSGDNFNILLRLEPSIELRTNVKVIRSKSSENTKCEVSVLFTDLDFKQREELIKYIFLMQRINLKKQKQIKS